MAMWLESTGPRRQTQVLLQPTSVSVTTDLGTLFAWTVNFMADTSQGDLVLAHENQCIPSPIKCFLVT